MFGQVVIGPPGSGKSTYCSKIANLLTAIGRKTCLINLDPANDPLYKPNINISDLISLCDTMQSTNLGPNGALIYCLEFLELNLDWLTDQLKDQQDSYLIFDFPGQVELFTHHNSVRNIIERLTRLDYRLCAVHLVDAHYCTDAGKYLSVLLVSLQTMIQLELPHINILSKIDLIESYGTQLAFNLDFYTEVQDLNYLLAHLNTSSETSKYSKLNKAILDLVQEFNLVSFIPMCIDDDETVLRVMRVVDKANGYVFGGLENGNESIFATANRVEDEDIMSVAERYIKARNEEIDATDKSNDEFENSEDEKINKNS